MLRRGNGTAPQHDNARALAACLKIKVRREIPVRGVVEQFSQSPAIEEAADSYIGVEQEAAHKSTARP
jgi:hypothetical protein